ncbi:MAG: hypothetical protein D8M58_21555 [Calditrichaeota bacterium]|nr:MAG: hypothetical protein DWQ03_17020 [Calditrichota bacterium]MBL1208001.1 hypothetical protein [Calditrichota bacterium]NOG47837.1 hypothetical protein [Calditrichota bacterium]
MRYIFSTVIIYFIYIIYLALPIKFPFNLDGDYTNTRLLIVHQVITGPNFRILNNIEKLKSINSDSLEINYSEVKLTGDNPLYHFFLGNCSPETLIVQGEFQGFTDEYILTGSGIIPIFKVDEWYLTKYNSRFFCEKRAQWHSQLMVYLAYYVIMLCWSEIETRK